MSKMKLRKRIPINYYKPEEPPLDEYIYCDKCGDYAYEYCSIHGPLFVIPDNQVPTETVLPSSVPRSALTIPDAFLHLAPSAIPGAGLGVFSSLTLPRGVRFGPYRGETRRRADSMYCWQIQANNKTTSHIIDGSDSNSSNWMRYVNCSRHWREQNLLAYQYQGQIYCRTIKIIPRFTELLVFYGSEFALAMKIDLRRYNSCDFNPNIDKVTAKKPKEVACTPPNENGSSQSNYMFANELLKERNDSLDSFDSNVPIEKTVYIYETEEIHKSQIQQSQIHQSVENAASQRNDFLKQTSERQNSNFETVPTNTCQICQKRCTSLYRLKCHLLTHKDFDARKLSSYKHICNVCSYPCETENNLIRHMIKKHGSNNISEYSNNPLPYEENELKKQTLKMEKYSNLETVMKFNCQICQKQFKDTYGFKRHLLTHAKSHNINLSSYSHVCDICSYPCETELYLIRHKHTKHAK